MKDSPVPTLASRARRASAVTISVALGFTWALLAAPAANAATFTVTSSADAGAGTLRQAVADANASAGPDTVMIAIPGSSITLDTTILVTEAVTIVGPGASNLMITRSGDFELLEFDMTAVDQDVSIVGISFDGGLGSTQRGLDFLDTEPVHNLVIQSAEFANFQTTVRGGAINIDGLTGYLIVNSTDFHDNVSIGNVQVPSLYAQSINSGFVSVSDSSFYDNFGESGAGLEIMFSDTEVTINDSTFDNNQTTNAGAGAFFYDLDGVTIRRTSFDNHESSSNRGGALYAAKISGEVGIEESAFSNSSSPTDGGAIAASEVGNLSIIDSTFTNNSAGFSGGAVWAELTGETFVSGSRFSLNSASVGGAITFDDLNGSASIQSSTLDQNSATGAGGAVFVDEVDFLLYFETDTFTANTSGDGSAVDVNAVTGDGVSVYRSTFSGNVSTDAASFGVGTINSGIAVVFANSTFVEDALTSAGIIEVGSNEGGLLVVSSTLVGNGVLDIGANNGEALVSHSIIDGDADGSGNQVFDVNGTTIIGIEYSILTTALDGGNMNSLSGNLLSTDPQLGALANNGGPTRTMLPANSSPAVNAGNAAYAFGYATDQRGAGFVREIGRVDIGAVELPLPTLAATGTDISPLVPIGAGALVLLGLTAIVVGRRRQRAL